MKASTELRTYSSTLKNFLNTSMLHHGYPMGAVHHTNRAKIDFFGLLGVGFFGFFKFELSLTGGKKMIFFFCIYSLVYISWGFQLCLLLSLYSATLSYSPPNIPYWSLDWSNLRFPLPLWKVFPHENDEGRSIKNTLTLIYVQRDC